MANVQVERHARHLTLQRSISSVGGGVMAGLCASLVTCPLDVLRTQRQVLRTEAPSIYRSALNVWHAEGVRGFYHGLGTTIIALIPTWSIYFGVYNQLKETFEERHSIPKTLVHLYSAAVAAAITDVATNPLWVIKTRLQTQHVRGHRKYNGPLHAYHTIVREEGYRALWQGLSPQLVGIIHVAIQFPLYERLKQWRMRAKGCSHDELDMTDLLLTSSLSKVVASTAAYPHELLRARLQDQRHTDVHRYHSLRNAMYRIYTDEGLKGFYRGMGVNLLRVVPSCAITFTVFEFVARAIKHAIASL